MRRTIMTGLAIILAAGVASPGEPTPEALLPVHEERDAYEPCAAFGKDVYLVCWQSGRTAPGDLRKEVKFCGDIVGLRLDKAGKPLDAKPFVVCGAADLQERPRAAFGGGNFLVVWQDLRPSTASASSGRPEPAEGRNGKDWDVYAARVTPDGKVLDPDGILVSGGPHNQAAPRVVWDGKAFLVAWEDYRSGRIYEVYCARVSAEGQVLDRDGVKLASENAGRRHRHSPEVASAGDGKSFVLSVKSGSDMDPNWEKNPAATGLFVTDGKAGDAVYVNTGREADGAKGNGPSGLCNPIAMAAGGGVYLAAYQTVQPHTGFKGGGSNAAIFDAGGGRKVNLTLGGKWIVLPDVAWDGEAFVVSWHEFLNDKDQGLKDNYNSTNQGRATSDVAFAARVSTDGQVLGETWKLSGVRAAPASNTAVASDGAGTSLVVYEKHPEKGDVPIKIAFRILTAK